MRVFSLLVSLLPGMASAQSLSWPYEGEACPTGSFFDTSGLLCTTCSSSQVRSVRNIAMMHRSCRSTACCSFVNAHLAARRCANLVTMAACLCSHAHSNDPTAVILAMLSCFTDICMHALSWRSVSHVVLRTWCQQVVAEDQSSCVCAPGYRQTSAAAGSDAAIGCTQCSSAASLDQKRCVTCDGSSGTGYEPAQLSGARCVCADSAGLQGVIADRTPDGDYFRDSSGDYTQRCIICPPSAVPDPATGTCLPCDFPKIRSDGGCVCPDSVSDGITCTGADVIQQAASTLGITLSSPYAASAQQSTGEASTAVSVKQSAALAPLLGEAADGCLAAADRDACNALANLCVLQLYDRCDPDMSFLPVKNAAATSILYHSAAAVNCRALERIPCKSHVLTPPRWMLQLNSGRLAAMPRHAKSSRPSISAEILTATAAAA